MLITKEVEVKPNGKMIQYYRDRGYAAKRNESLIIDIDDLPIKSSTHITVSCDYCGDILDYIRYSDYSRSIQKYGNYACKKCGIFHQKDTCVKKYGFDNPTKSPEIRQKQIDSLMEHYGVDSPLKNDLIMGKAIKTTMARFGVPYAPQSMEIKEKQAKSMYSASTQKCSKQQLYLYNLYNYSGNLELNYPIKYYSTDICIPDENIVIEYDGGGHALRVDFGRMTQKEFDQRELVRSNVIRRAGYKQMRIISTQDKLPSDEILLQMLEQAKQYFSDYPNHSWIEFNIDTSIVRNAEHKDSVFFDYGKLRKIK